MHGATICNELTCAIRALNTVEYSESEVFSPERRLGHNACDGWPKLRKCIRDNRARATKIAQFPWHVINRVPFLIKTRKPNSAMTLLQTLSDTIVLGTELLRLTWPWPRSPERSSAGRHLAFFAWTLPPHTSAGVHRPLSFLRHASRAGWRADAFCGEAGDGQLLHREELLSQVPAEAIIHVFPASSRQPSYRLFPRVDGGFPNALEYARRTIKLLADDPPDLVIASGPPFFTFVAAMFVARRFGATLVLDYRDEWSECPFGFVDRSGHDRAWERRCLMSADVVLFTTESHRRHQLATFPELTPNKAHVVPNGWVPDDFATLERERSPSPASQAGSFRLSHVGTSAGHSSPQDFLDTLGRLLTNKPELVPRIRVQFIGRRSPSADREIRRFGSPDVIEVIDQVGKREANRRMQDSDALLLIATKDLERYLPGKLFDYLAARRPVLVFGYAGEASALVERLGAGIFCEAGTPTALREALTRLQRLEISPDDDAINKWLNEHRRDVLASRAFTIIESAMATGRSQRPIA